MDFLHSLQQGFMGPDARRFDPASLLKFTELHPQVQKHLAKVYATLCFCIAACAVGCWLGLLYGAVLPFTLPIAIGCILGLAFIRPTPQNLNKRYALLGGFSFTQGCSLTPLVAMASAHFPGVVLTAMLGTAAVFLCFTGSALMTRRRSWMFLSGYLSSALLALAALPLARHFLLPRSLAGFSFDVELYVGFLVFAGYVLFDTQLIVERAYSGDMDHIKHAQDLLVNLLGMFVRLVVILMKNAEQREQREREEAERRRRREKRY